MPENFSFRSLAKRSINLSPQLQVVREKLFAPDPFLNPSNSMGLKSGLFGNDEEKKLENGAVF